MPKVTLNTVPSPALVQRLGEEVASLLGMHDESVSGYYRQGMNLMAWIDRIQASGNHETARALEDCALHKDAR